MEFTIDGFYSAFLTGREGNTFAMFLIRQGVVTGADVLGGTYDGTVEAISNGAYRVKTIVRTPPNLPIIQGGMSGSGGDISEIEFILPATFMSEPFIAIKTKYGPVNAKIIKVRELND